MSQQMDYVIPGDVQILLRHIPQTQYNLYST